MFDENGNGPARYGAMDAPVKVAAAVAPPQCKQIDDSEEVVPEGGSDVRADGGVTPPPGGTAGGTTAPPPGGSGGALQAAGPTPAQTTCERSDRPIYCEVWLWGIVGGVVVAGAGVAVYFAVRDDGGDPRRSVPIAINAGDPTALRWSW